MYLYTKFDQNIPCCSGTMSILLTDGRTDSHSDNSADPRVGQGFSSDPRVVQDSHSDYSADPRLMQYSADPRVVQFKQDNIIFIFITSC